MAAAAWRPSKPRVDSEFLRRVRRREQQEVKALPDSLPHNAISYADDSEAAIARRLAKLVS